jgi:hypothetical protein
MNAFGDERARLRAMGTFQGPGMAQPHPLTRLRSLAQTKAKEWTVNLNVAGSCH